MRAKNIEGRRFFMLEAVCKVQTRVKSTNAHWYCLCDCGNGKVINASKLTTGKTKSCGCFGEAYKSIIKRKHGKYGTPEYQAWASMLDRCSNSKSASYKNYGERGIFVCDEWRNFEVFYRDMGDRPSKRHSIDRIDNEDGYHPANCKWSLPHEQQQNTRQTKFSKSDIVKIAELRNQGLLYREIAEIYQCSESAIGLIIRGERWLNVRR